MIEPRSWLWSGAGHFVGSRDVNGRWDHDVVVAARHIGIQGEREGHPHAQSHQLSADKCRRSRGGATGESDTAQS